MKRHVSIKGEWVLIAGAYVLVLLAGVTISSPALMPVYIIVLMLSMLRVLWLMRELRRVVGRMHEITALMAEGHLEYAQGLDREHGTTSHAQLVKLIADDIRQLGTAARVVA